MSAPNSVSPKKRKYAEYHDPDYPVAAGQAPISAQRSQTAGVDINKNNKLQQVREIILKEFDHEIAVKKQQLEEINDRLVQSQRLLDRLRYSIVAQYYKRQEQSAPTTTTLEAINSVRGQFNLHDETTSMPPSEGTNGLHPSLKKIIGKKPCNLSDLLKTCPKRTAALNANNNTSHISTNVKPKTKTQRSTKKHSQSSESNPTAALKFIKPPPQNKELNAVRLHNKVKHLIVIGNTSKFISSDGPAERALPMEAEPTMEHRRSDVASGGISHKWIVYIQNKNAAIPLQTFVRKVRFFLDPSYRPKDVVEITAPPFQLARRGWGEFPVRIKIFFLEHLQQKPLQVVHNLVLDKTRSGFHKLGAETIAEIWLPAFGQKLEDEAAVTGGRVFDASPSAAGGSHQTTNQQTEILPGKDEDVIIPIDATINTAARTDICLIPAGSTKPSPTVKQFPPVPTGNGKVVLNKHGNIILEKSANLKPAPRPAPAEPLKSPFRSRSEGQATSNHLLSGDSKQNSVLNSTANKHIVFQRAGKVYIIDPLQVKLKQQSQRQESLLKPQVSILKKQQSTPFYRSPIAEHDYANPMYLSSLPLVQQADSPSQSLPHSSPAHAASRGSVAAPLHFGMRDKRLAVRDARELAAQRQRKFEKAFQQLQFTNVQPSVEYLLRRVPLIAKKSAIAASYTFVMVGEKEFHALSGIRQRSNEWLRAKWIERQLINHTAAPRTTVHSGLSTLWSTREIVMFARQHAYTPPLKPVLAARGPPSRIWPEEDEDPGNCVSKAVVKREPQCDSTTLSSPESIQKWLTSAADCLRQKERLIGEEELIDVTDDVRPEMSDQSLQTQIKQHAIRERSTQSSPTNWQVDLPELEHLRNELNIVQHVSRQSKYNFANEGVADSLSQSVVVSAVLAESLHLFVSRLLRSAVAMKHSTLHPNGMCEVPLADAVSPEDICAVINNFSEFDFLSNRYLGIPKYFDP